MAEGIDVRFRKGNNDYFDITIADNGDLEGIDSFDTDIYIRLFSDARADESQVEIPQNRRGYWANEFREENEKAGSLLWLLYQARNTQDTANDAVTFCQNALQGMIDNGSIDDIEIITTRIIANLEINIDFIKNKNKVANIAFDLWQNFDSEV